ncbi:MAG: 3-phosphoshikimate 1-carboxyvinyltransferase [Candidatus Caldarchaeum sp.]|nr:3-phosphoshikimate 1-carboxyvinyltransferase [Candidatus Caldarchaeum sp.]
MRTVFVRKSLVEGVVEAPPSKSYTHRAFAIASLCTEKTVINNPLISRDTAATINASQMLGVQITKKENSYEVVGRRKFTTPENIIDVMNSGTTLRIYTGLSTLVEKGYTVLTGDESIRRRPMQPLLQSLNDVGAETRSTRENGKAPIIVKGGNRIGGRTSIKGTESSQYVSSLLLTGLGADDEVIVEVRDELVSKPYVEATVHMVRVFGGDISRKGFEEFRSWPQSLRGTVFTVPGDFSSAAFIAAAAHLTNGHIHIKNLTEEFPQADSEIVKILRHYGSEIRFVSGGLDVWGGRRDVDAEIVLTDCPDLLPVTAAVAAVNEGETRIRGVAHARFKESDRVASVASEIRKLGVDVEEHADGLTIRGSSKTEGGVVVDSHDDHRLFMAFTVLGLALEKGLYVTGAESADVSYPSFLTDLKNIGAKISEAP